MFWQRRERQAMKFRGSDGLNAGRVADNRSRNPSRNQARNQARNRARAG